MASPSPVIESFGNRFELVVDVDHFKNNTAASRSAMDYNYRTYSYPCFAANTNLRDH